MNGSSRSTVQFLYKFSIQFFISGHELAAGSRQKQNHQGEVKRQLTKMYWLKPANTQPIHQPIAQKVITVIPFKKRYWLIG